MRPRGTGALRLALWGNAARGAFCALRLWGKARPSDTRALLCLVPAAIGAMAGIGLWVFVSPPLVTYLSAAVIAISLSHTTVTAVAFFAGGTVANAENRMGALDREREQLREALGIAQVERAERRSEGAAARSAEREKKEAERLRRQEAQAARARIVQEERAKEAGIRAQQRVACPRCGSVEIHSAKRGYSAGTGSCGCCLLGPVGLILGLLGSSDVTCTCLACGRKFKAGRGRVV